MKLKSVLFFAAILLPGCMGDQFDDDITRSQRSLETTSEYCGSNESERFAMSCDELLATCYGTFICYDETLSEDGRCETWGECSYDDEAEPVAEEGKIKYGPVITIKPKG